MLKVGLLIEEVKKRPFLYDSWHKDYKRSVNKTNAAWAEIARVCKAPNGKAAKNKWKLLKDGLRDSLKKQTVLNKVKIPRKYKYQDLLSFVIPTFRNPSFTFTSNLNPSSPVPSTSPKMEEELETLGDESCVKEEKSLPCEPLDPCDPLEPCEAMEACDPPETKTTIINTGDRTEQSEQEKVNAPLKVYILSVKDSTNLLPLHTFTRSQGSAIQEIGQSSVSKNSTCTNPTIIFTTNFNPTIPSKIPQIPTTIPPISSTTPPIPSTILPIPSTIPPIPSTIPQITSTFSQIPSTIPQTLSTIPAIPSTIPKITSTFSQIPSTIPKITSTFSQASSTISPTPSTIPKIKSSIPQTSSTIMPIPSTIPKNTSRFKRSPTISSKLKALVNNPRVEENPPYEPPKKKPTLNKPRKRTEQTEQRERTEQTEQRDLNNPLKLYFLSMYESTRRLPLHSQRKIKEDLFKSVMKEELRAANDAGST